MAGEDETPDDSIASALASALAEHEKPAAESAPAAKPAEKAPVKAAESDAAETEAEGQAAEAEAGEPQEDDGAAAEAKEGEAKPAASGTEPPANWKAADKETFRKLPPEAQKFLLDRHKAMEGDYIKKTQAIAAFKREYDPVAKIFEPYQDRMKAAGWTPGKMVEAWANVEKRLMNGEGVDVIAGLTRAYQVNLGEVARALGLRPRQPANNGSGAVQPGEPDRGTQDVSLSPDHPVIRTLQNLQSRIDARERADMDAARRQQTAAETRVMSQIEEFKSATDGNGNLLHPHFEELEGDMTRLAQSANAAGKPMSLKDLYEAAQWANPSIREATLAARERAQQEKAAADARAKAAAARKAGSSVTGAPGSGQAPIGKNRADRNLHDELEAAFSQHAGGRI